MSDFEVPEAFKEVARLLHTQSDDAARRNAEIAAEAAETQAWDAYVLSWLHVPNRGPGTDEEIADAAAKFANRMIEHRRKAFGVELLGSPVESDHAKASSDE
jgi:hypothetical protein